jgi:hypothetical protein
VLLVVELYIEVRDLDVLDTVVSNLNQRSCILGTKLNSIKPLAYCKPGALSTELRIQFILSSRKKQAKKNISSIRKNPPRERNIPGLSLKKHKALESKVSKRRLSDVERNLIAQRSDFNDAST